MVDVEEFFHKKYEMDSDYLMLKLHKEMYDNIKKILNPLLKGEVLDMGNGGVFIYDTTKAKKIVAVDVAFRDISKYKKFPNVTYKYEDSRSLKTIHSSSFDIVISQFMFHHIARKSNKKTLADLQKVIETTTRILKPGGTMIIIDNTAPRIIEFLEKIFYPITYLFLKLLKKPMVFMFSSKTILKFIKKNNFKDIDCKIIPFGKKIDAFPTLKTNLFLIPGWMAPFKCRFFTAKKLG